MRIMPEPATRVRRTPAAPMGAAPAQSSRVSIREIKKVLNEADRSPRGHSLSDVTCPTSILIGRTYVEDDLRLLGPSPSCGSRSNAPCPDAYSGKSRQF